MPKDKKKKLHKLSDISVDTVGLVSFGANQEKFFLLKSHNQEDEMPNEDTVVEGVQTDETFWSKLKGIVKGEVEAIAKGAETDADIDSEGVAPDADGGESNEVIEKMNSQMEELRKANVALLERLDKAEKKAAEEEEKREKQEYLEKASTLDKLPVKQEELASHLREVYKSDAERGEYFFALLKSVNEMLEDTQIFEEAGTSESNTDDGEPISVEKLSELAKTGKAEDIKKAMLEMGEDEAWKYLDAERKRVKGA